MRRNGCPKGCFWGVRCFSASLRFSGVLRANLEGAEKKRTLQKHLFGQLFQRTKTAPKSGNTQKTLRSHEFFRKVRANLCLLHCVMSQELSGNCSEKLVQMNFFILGGFFRVDFPPLMFLSTTPSPLLWRALGNGRNTVSRVREENSLSLTEFWANSVCSAEKLGELALAHK